ncbi:hypothetical protein SAMD00019534_018220 [Acytostelium subglobosum LB1]|uniref:hypothetical protein n=1 Tax=Acytostelium subglobosum LB1 TaxID=1410327 RepID=UPI0006451F01|nr:hypothetical protein SAMD00019534_018220 [Acytostelium subglobosum LB1]GAM18647.1 hypothetical protein SAMD00019534_018220 [Acytostelium subglobosum LB1]|eukprot:XP_012757867.1 hypothetical protein SAMD00019534_018220 [Acytostelium subglobosum LB1]
MVTILDPDSEETFATMIETCLVTIANVVTSIDNLRLKMAMPSRAHLFSVSSNNDQDCLINDQVINKLEEADKRSKAVAPLFNKQQQQPKKAKAKKAGAHSKQFVQPQAAVQPVPSASQPSQTGYSPVGSQPQSKGFRSDGRHSKPPSSSSTKQ